MLLVFVKKLKFRMLTREWLEQKKIRREFEKSGGSFVMCGSGKDGLLFQAKAAETFVEFRNATAAIDNAMLTRPSRMRLGIDIQTQYVAFFAIGRFRFEFGSVSHHHGNFMVIGMDGVFHNLQLRKISFAL
jgi:hypothetical protein